MEFISVDFDEKSVISIANVSLMDLNLVDTIKLYFNVRDEIVIGIGIDGT